MEERPICVKCKTRVAEKHSVRNGKQHYRKTCASCRRQRPQYIVRLILQLGKNPNKCEECNVKFPFSCEVHHIDRNRENNNGNNLKVLCPNCHTLTHYKENGGLPPNLKFKCCLCSILRRKKQNGIRKKCKRE